uniref:Uncharacterized protein n=1 Tax=Panagrolaimus sp. JU765 TaxID=591449 RepID=A0AC34QKV6_9BILA
MKILFVISLIIVVSNCKYTEFPNPSSFEYTFICRNAPISPNARVLVREWTEMANWPPWPPTKWVHDDYTFPVPRDPYKYHEDKQRISFTIYEHADTNVGGTVEVEVFFMDICEGGSNAEYPTAYERVPKSGIFDMTPSNYKGPNCDR